MPLFSSLICLPSHIAHTPARPLYLLFALPSSPTSLCPSAAYRLLSHLAISISPPAHSPTAIYLSIPPATPSLLPSHLPTSAASCVLQPLFNDGQRRDGAGPFVNVRRYLPATFVTCRTTYSHGRRAVGVATHARRYNPWRTLARSGDAAFLVAIAVLTPRSSRDLWSTRLLRATAPTTTMLTTDNASAVPALNWIRENAARSGTLAVRRLFTDWRTLVNNAGACPRLHAAGCR